MEEDTLNILSEIEKKCQEQADDNFDKIGSITGEKSQTEGLGAMADDTNTNELSEDTANATVTNISSSEATEHSYCIQGEGDAKLNGHNDAVGTSNTDETVKETATVGDKQCVETPSDNHSQETGTDNHTEEIEAGNNTEETEAGNNTEETAMEVDDSEETEDLGQKQAHVNGNVNDDNEDGNSDIVEFDVNVNADAQNDDSDRSVDLSQEIDGTIEIQENSDTDTDEEETGDRADESINSVEGDRSYSQEEYSSDLGNTSGIPVFDEADSGTPGHHPLIRKDGRPRKRRKKWGKGWSALRGNKSRKLDKIVIRRYEKMTSAADKGTDAEMYVDIVGNETGEGTSSAEAGI